MSGWRQQRLALVQPASVLALLAAALSAAATAEATGLVLATTSRSAPGSLMAATLVAPALAAGPAKRCSRER